VTDSFERMLVIAGAVATFSCTLGAVVSFHIDDATGACIVLIQSLVFESAPRPFQRVTGKPAPRRQCQTRPRLGANGKANVG
jgi:hypothetical protein